MLVALGWSVLGSCPVFAATATTVAITVTSAGSAVTSVPQGATVTLTATVLAESTPVTVGQVDFCDATATHCTDIHLLTTVQLTNAGTAIFKFRPGPGSHSYKAVFLGTITNAGSSSSASPLSVSAPAKLPTRTAIAQSGSSGNYTLTTVGGNGSTAPTGTVSFLDTSNGNATAGTATLAAGTGFGFVNSSNPTAGTGGIAIATGDFNGDGVPDLVVADTPSGLTILLGNGDGTFTPTVANPATGIDPGAIAVGDFNGDGIPDLAAVNLLSFTATVLLGKGDGTFTATSVNLPADVDAWSIAAADFNGDGIQDLAVTESALSGETGTVTILLGNGDGTFTPTAASPATGGRPYSIVAGDFNRDGIADLVVVNSGTYPNDSDLTVLLGNGDGTFTPTSTNPLTGVDPDSIAAADFNEDGILDLAVANAYSNTLSILLGNGDGTFTPTAVSPVTGSQPSSVAVGDFNGDGVPDLAVSNVGTGAGGSTVTVLLGNGDGSFSATATAPPTGLYPERLAVADFNGDGLTDVAAGLDSGTTPLVNETVLLAASQVATATTSISLGAGAHLVDASYPGDTNYNSSLSVPIALTGPTDTTTLTLTVTPNSAVLSGQSVTLTATLSPSSAQGHATDGETISFYNGNSVLGTGTLAGGTATLVLPVTYSYSVTAGYAGDAYLSASTSNAQSLVVGPPVSTTLTLTANPSPSTHGQPVTLTATLSPYSTQGVSSDGGFVTFAGTAVVQSTTTLSSGVASVSVSPMPVGTYSVQATFAGTAAFAPSASQTILLTVNPATPTVTLASSANPALVSNPVTFTATLSAWDLKLPLGGMIFFDGTTELGEVPTNSNLTSFTTTALTTGAHTITAEYTGDANDLAATSAALTETIEDFTLGSSNGGSVSPATASPGGMATYLLAVDPPAGTTFPAAVTFSVSGLPTGATATFSPTMLPANSGPTNVTMTVALSSQVAAKHPRPKPFDREQVPMALGLIMLPFVVRLRKDARRSKRIICLFAVVMTSAAMIASLSACGSSGSSMGSTLQPQTYTLTITATSGSLSQSTTTSLTVK